MKLIFSKEEIVELITKEIIAIQPENTKAIIEIRNYSSDYATVEFEKIEENIGDGVEEHIIDENCTSVQEEPINLNEIPS